LRKFLHRKDKTVQKELKKKKNFISMFDLKDAELHHLIKRAMGFKRTRRKHLNTLKGKGIVLLFEKSSTRTRVSFEAAIHELGGYSIYLSSKDAQLSRGETIADTARTLSRYTDAIVLRTFAHSTIVEMGNFASVPVINALSDLLHPCQALADVMTIIEYKGKFDGLKMAYVGDGNNVANSLIEASAVFGFEIWIGCPPGFEPDSGVLESAINRGGKVNIVASPVDAVRHADVVYTDVWTSMGQEGEEESRREIFRDYQLNSNLLSVAKRDAIVMHCLPAHRGEEITSDVIDGPNSVVWDQAENRLHVQKAILEFLLK
jgi:ornithine carbamoyltransferase